MILRPVRNMDLPLFLLLLSWSTAALASDFNCRFQLGPFSYDLSPLDGEQVITRERTTPPTREVDSVRLSLCSDSLKPEEGVSETDQCPAGTRVCLTKINYKDDQKRIVSVIPIAQTATLDPSYSALSSPKGVSVVFHGGSYPHPIDATDTPQSVNITFLCDTPDPSPPTFTSYDGAQLRLEWSTPHGCGFKADDGDHENDGNDKSESGSLSSVGWFLLLVVVAFVMYLGVGAYHNYSEYGASGLDLLPHRDFWMEVPYMLRDVLSHLCSTVRPRRSSNRGYIAV